MAGGPRDLSTFTYNASTTELRNTSAFTIVDRDKLAKRKAMERGSLKERLGGQDGNGGKQNAAGNGGTMHASNTENVDAKEYPTEWRSLWEEYKSFPRDLNIKKAPLLRLGNRDRLDNLRTLSRAGSRGEVPYETELDDEQRGKMYEDVRRDMRNIRMVVKQAKRERSLRNQGRSLWELIDRGCEWSANGSHWDRRDRTDVEDSEDEYEEENSEEQLSNDKAEALEVGSESVEKVDAAAKMGEAGDDEPDGLVFRVSGNFDPQVREQGIADRDTATTAS
jgi:hypothetical protein